MILFVMGVRQQLEKMCLIRSLFTWLCFFCLTCQGSLITRLRYHEVMHAGDLSHTIVKRGVNSSPHPFNKIKELSFTTLGREFKLMLSPRKYLLHSQFKAYEVDKDGAEKLHHIDPEDHDLYEGRVFGEVQSAVSAMLEDGVMTATVRTKDDTYHIEPAWRHLDDPQRTRMITYRSSDVVDGQPVLPQLGTRCAAVREEGNATGPEWGEEGGPGPHARAKRQTTEAFTFNIMKTRCPLLLVADYRFYKDMGSSNTKTTINYLISLIDRVDKIYRDTVWAAADRPGDHGHDLGAMGFVIKKIVVHNEYTPMARGQEHYNMETSSWDVRHLLEVFSRDYSHKDFCLAHLFTDIRFDGGILGLAYVGSPRRNSVGGICTPEYFKNGFTLYLNSGLSSSRNHYGQRVITREADLVTAHEFGHNWGSEHDPDMAECSPSASKGGSFLMYTYSVSGYDLNNKRFSPCSLRSINLVLKAKSSRCFTEPEESFCGNLRVEGDEQCDAGLVGSEDEDQCCDKNCQLRVHGAPPTAVCSDKNSPCCNSCQYMQMGTKCRDASRGTCEKEATCDGVSAECPPSAPMEDRTECQEHGGQCVMGKCMSFCELNGLHSCMCDVEMYACNLCCRKSLNDTCTAQEPLRTLSGGTPCMHGLCTNSGVCEKTVQDVVERFWDIIEDININKVLRFLRDNIVGTVLVISIIIWVPASCVFSYVDAKRRREEEEEVAWQRRDQLIRPGERRVVYTRRRLPERDRPTEYVGASARM